MLLSAFYSFWREDSRYRASLEAVMQEELDHASSSYAFGLYISLCASCKHLDISMLLHHLIPLWMRALHIGHPYSLLRHLGLCAMTRHQSTQMVWVASRASTTACRSQTAAEAGTPTTWSSGKMQAADFTETRPTNQQNVRSDAGEWNWTRLIKFYHKYKYR